MWKLRVLKRAEKALAKVNKPSQIKIIEFLDKILLLDEPHKKAKALRGKLVGLWRFRIGDFRVIAKIDNTIITILVLDIGHRKDVYK